MSVALCLPHAPASLPADFDQRLAFPAHEPPATLQELLTVFQQLGFAPQAKVDVIGSLHTPALFWFAARTYFPQAVLWCMQGNGCWLNLNQAKDADPTPPAPRPQAPSVPEPPAKQPPPVANHPVAVHKTPPAQPVSEQALNQLLFDLFRFHAWNTPEAERLAQESLENFATNPAVLEQINKAVAHGKHAYQLTLGLNRRLNQGWSINDLQEWLDKLAENQPAKVLKHLRITLEKRNTWRKKQKEKSKHRHQFSVTLPQVHIQPGQAHPQSLRALPPSAQWTLLIDETGSKFGSDVDHLSDEDKNLGRVVALALPQNSNLAELDSATHAVDLPHAQLQRLTQQLINSNSGIFGASVKQHALRSNNWISAVAQLTRWALLMLPMAGATRVKVLIENRAPYQDSVQLKALSDTLESQLKRLAPERFGELHLSLEIMDKQHPHNGYVDLIANLWGNNDTLKDQLLQRTAWLDHCLLYQSDLQQIEHFYERLSHQDTLAAKDWFALCSLQGMEPEHSLLRHLANQAGQKTLHQPALWQGYLDEVRLSVQQKTFTAPGLAKALEWLEAYRPADQQLPGYLALRLQSLRLAASNHLGEHNPELLESLLQLAEQLRDEMAPEACEVALRAAISPTHALEFTQQEAPLVNWLAQPLAVPGLLNHGKLHSTLGQLAAFRGETDKALAAFEQALASFGRLSDPQQAEKESRQTLSYRALTLLDAGDSRATAAIENLLNQATRSTGQKSTQRLGRSGDLLRFEQYLLLRWLISQPEQQALRRAYLDVKDDWQSGAGHPWMLIDAYRGWLLADAGEKEAAEQCFEQAVSACQAHQNSLLLQWMGAGLHALASSLKLEVQPPSAQAWPAAFNTEALIRLQNASQHTQRLQALAQLLPFNFH